MGNIPSLLKSRNTRRINGTIDVSKMKDINLKNEWFGESSNQAIGITEPRNQLYEQFELSWVIKDWPNMSQSLERLKYPDFKAGPDHLWSIKMRINRGERTIGVSLKLKGISGSANFIESACSMTLFADDQHFTIGSPNHAFRKLEKGQTFIPSWRISPRLFEIDSIRVHFIVWVKKIPFKRKWIGHSLMTSQSLQSSKPSPLTSSNDGLARDFGSLLQSKKGSDLILVVGSAKFKAHKTILSARSPVFDGMLSVPMKESAESKVFIKDFEPKVVKAMLEYIYTGKTKVKGDSTGDLLLIAEKYQLPELVAECETVLISDLTIYKAIQVLKLASLVISATALKIRSIEFIIANIDEVSQTKDYQELVKSNPELLAEILAWKY